MYPHHIVLSAGMSYALPITFKPRKKVAPSLYYAFECPEISIISPELIKDMLHVKIWLTHTYIGDVRLQ